MTTLHIPTPKTLICTSVSLAATAYLTPPLVPHQLYLHHILIPQTLLIGSLLLPIPPAAALPPLTASYLYLLRAYSITPWSTAISFVTGLVTASHLFMSLSLLVFTDPKREFQRHGRGYPESMRERVSWVMNLVHSPRLIGWNVEQPTPDLPAPTTGQRLRSLALCYAYLDFLSWYMKLHSPSNFLPPSPHVTPLAAVLGASGIYAGIQAVYMAFSLFCIHLLRWGSDSDWPHVFGPLSALGDEGVAGFWTNGWHGILRFWFTAPGKWSAKATEYERRSGSVKTSLKLVFNLVLPFAVSGALHYGAAVTRECDGWSVAGFFLLQPLAIMLENRIQEKVAPKLIDEAQKAKDGKKIADTKKSRKGKKAEVEKKTGDDEKKTEVEQKTQGIRRLVRWGWTFCWLVWSSRGFWEGFGGGGLWLLEPVPMSLWRGMRGECPWRWGGVGGWWAPAGEGGVLGQWAWKL